MSFSDLFRKFDPTAPQGSFPFAPPANAIVAPIASAPVVQNTSTIAGRLGFPAANQNSSSLGYQSDEEEDDKDNVEDDNDEQDDVDDVEEDRTPISSNPDQCIGSCYNLLSASDSKVTKANNYLNSISLIQNSLPKPQRDGVQVAENESLLVYALRNGGVRVYHKKTMVETIFNKHEALVCDVLLFQRFDKVNDASSFTVATLDVDDSLFIWHVIITPSKSLECETVVKIEPEKHSLFRRIFYFTPKNIPSSAKIPAQLIVHHDSSFSVLNLDNSLLKRVKTYNAENGNDNNDAEEDDDDMNPIPINQLCSTVHLQSRSISDISLSANEKEFIAPCNDSSILFVDRQNFSLVRKVTLAKTRTIEPILSAFELYSSDSDTSKQPLSSLILTTARYNTELRLWKNNKCTHELVVASPDRNRSAAYIVSSFEYKGIIVLSDKNSGSNVIIRVNTETSLFEIVSQIELKSPTYSIIPMVQSFHPDALEFGFLQLNQNGIDCHKINISELFNDSKSTSVVKIATIVSAPYVLLESREKGITVSEALIPLSQGLGNGNVAASAEFVDEVKNLLSEHENRENMTRENENKALIEKLMVELPEKLQGSMSEQISEKLGDSQVSRLYLNAIINVLREDIERMVRDAVNQELKAKISSEIKSSMSELSKSVVKDMSQVIRASFNGTYTNNIIPAFRDGFQEMGQQLSAAMKSPQQFESVPMQDITQTPPPRQATATPNTKQKIQRPASSASNASTAKKGKQTTSSKADTESADEINDKFNQVLNKTDINDLKKHLEKYDPSKLFKIVELRQVTLVFLAQQVCQMISSFPDLAFKWLPVILKQINMKDPETIEYFPNIYESMAQTLEVYMVTEGEKKEEAAQSFKMIQTILQGIQ